MPRQASFTGKTSQGFKMTAFMRKNKNKQKQNKKKKRKTVIPKKINHPFTVFK